MCVCVLAKFINTYNRKNNSAKSPTVSRLPPPFITQRYTYIHETTSKMSRGAYIIITHTHTHTHTHTLTITYTTIHNNTQVQSTRTHTHTHTQRKDLYAILT